MNFNTWLKLLTKFLFQLNRNICILKESEKAKERETESRLEQIKKVNKVQYHCGDRVTFLKTMVPE